MTVHPRLHGAWLGAHRVAFKNDPEGAVIAYVRALNSVALDRLSTMGPNDLYTEAATALEGVIVEYGATSLRVSHIVKVLINDAQSNAFAEGPGWPDLGRALDAAERALVWQQELVDYVSNYSSEVPDRVRKRVQSDTIDAYLTLARVQAACALLEEALASFNHALEHYEPQYFQDEWGDVIRSVGQEVGADPMIYGGNLPENDRTTVWYWYGP